MTSGVGRNVRMLFALAAAAVSGCSAIVHERHYFAAFRDNPEGMREPVQFYRLTVDGHTYFSNTRYLTGYFDERALSLFFNEIKAPANQRLFDDAMVLPGSGGTKLQPLSPTQDDAAFVMIMSTNADAVASTIGSFAESQAVADAVTRMLNRDRVLAKDKSDATLAVDKARASALVSQVQAQAAAASAAGSGREAARSYLRALTALARGLGYDGAEFTGTEGARMWFVLESARAGAQP
ncbi:MAG: hypothetical protein HZC37_04805 [Burkholderiales bacterium]|nr:hypothetical protein [Burkholderiales bacterium]